ncbi:MAG: sulfatase [Planctomycetes bacterium]|nr:sulfatase [Planctomycetota bacterium]
MLLADDMGGRDLGCYGQRDVSTPVLDALAASGALFERAYTAVGVCQPSRSSVYTGLYPTRHGALGFGPIRTDVATWPELLNARGVATAMIGKLDVDPLEKFPFETLVKANEMSSRRDAAVWDGHLREFLNRAGQRPFAAVLALVDPHRPFDEDDAPRVTDPARIAVPPSLWDTPGTRRELARYYDCIARLDATVGRLLATLRDFGHGDDTLVVFTADNGPSFPFAKSTLYEAGVRMPLVVSGPGVVRGPRRELVGLVDLLPTALELFGAPAVPCDGGSLLPLLHGESITPRSSIVTMQTDNNREQSRPARALHGERFKYIRNFGPDMATVSNVVGHTETWESGKELARVDAATAGRMRSYLYRPQEELYDLERDPLELVELSGNDEFASVRERMRDELRAWMGSHQDPLLAEWNA